MMEFSQPYVLAMREQAPKLFNQLRRTGALPAHLKAKSAEAHRMYDQLAADLPKLENGLLRSPSDHQQIQEQVRGLLIEFPADNPTPDDQLQGDQTPTSLDPDLSEIQTTPLKAPAG